VWTIIFNILRILDLASKSSMFLLLAILALEDTGVYICFLYYYNEAFYIEISINQVFSFTSTLDVLYVQPYNHHVQFR